MAVAAYPITLAWTKSITGGTATMNITATDSTSQELINLTFTGDAVSGQWDFVITLLRMITNLLGPPVPWTSIPASGTKVVNNGA